MRARARGHLHLAFPAAATVGLALLAVACGSGSPPPAARHGPAPGSSATSSTSSSTTTTGATPSTLAPVSATGPLQPGAPIALPFSADRVTAAESPDGAVFVAPQQPGSPAPAVAWVVDGDGPAAVAEHVPNGIAALAADGTNFYAATASTVYAYDRASGNQDGQWSLPGRAADRTDAGALALAAAGGHVLVSTTHAGAVSVYRITPSSSAPPRLWVRGLGAAVGADGSVYSETPDHHLAARRPDGTTATGPALAATPNGLGGGVQDVDVVAGGAVWVREPAGQGLDARFTTYDTTTLAVITSYDGTVTSSVADSAAGPLVLLGAGSNPQCPPASTGTASACVARIDTHGTVSDATGVGAAITLLGPGPAVVQSDLATGQFDLVRLS